MGIMVAYSADDVRELNRKQRTKMSAIKEGFEDQYWLVEEGTTTSP